MDTNQPATKKNTSKWLWALLALVVLGGLGYLGWTYRSTIPFVGSKISASPSTVADICPCGQSDEATVPYEELGKCVYGGLSIVISLNEIDSAKEYLSSIPGLSLGFGKDFPPRYVYAFKLTTDNYDYVKNFGINENLQDTGLMGGDKSVLYISTMAPFSQEDVIKYEDKYKVQITDNSNYRISLVVPKGKETEIYNKIITEKPTYKIGPGYVSEKFPVMHTASNNKDYCYKYEIKGLNVSF